MPSAVLGAPSPPRLHSRWLLLCCCGLIAAHLDFSLICFWQGDFLVSEGGGVGYDFACFWGAGRLALQGQALAAYDWSQLKDFLDHEMAFSADPLRPALPFFYPPTFFLAITPLALLPFAAALVVWLGATLAAYLTALRAIVPGPTAVMTALAAPMVFFDMWVGQNGLLTAALLGGALALLDRRPLASGALLGFLVYKPHFGVLLPLVLAATGRWRVVGSAVATIALLAGATGVFFGWQIFATAGGALLSASHYNLVSGVTPWFKLQSIYGMLRDAGFDAGAAWAVHGVVAAVAASATLMIWRGRYSYALKAASLSTAAMLLPPYMAIYDLPLLAVPIAFLVRDGLERGFPRRDALALKLALPAGFALIYLFPFLHEPAGPLCCAGLVVLIASRLLPALSSRIEPRLAPS